MGNSGLHFRASLTTSATYIFTYIPPVKKIQVKASAISERCNKNCTGSATYEILTYRKCAVRSSALNENYNRWLISGPCVLRENDENIICKKSFATPSCELWSVDKIFIAKLVEGQFGGQGPSTAIHWIRGVR